MSSANPDFFIFFYWSTTHRDLHSFPTRRSSDLDCWGALRGVPGPKRRGGHWAEIFQAARVCRQLARALEKSDRKSTRLNSSHRTISYAVFCLKKKIKPTDQQRVESDSR